MEKSACHAVGKKCTRCGKEGHFSSAYMTVHLNNNAVVQLQIDTGASCKFLPKSDYIRATGDKQCKNLEQSYQTVVWPLGQIRLLTERKGRNQIVKQDLTPLLCKTTCEKMNLVKILDADINVTNDERMDV